jgi:hypothetical protein
MPSLAFSKQHLVERPQIIQTAFTEITVDTTTTSTSFTDLLSLTIVTDNNPVICHFSASADNTGVQDVDFQLVIDGVAQRGCALRVIAAGFGTSAELVDKSAALSIGSHTIKIQWQVSGNTGQIRPATNIDEHASLLVEEVTR